MGPDFVKVGSGNKADIARVLKKAGFVYSEIVRIQVGSYGSKIKRINGDFTIAYDANKNQFTVFGWHKSGMYKPADFLLEPLKKFGAVAKEFKTKGKPQIYVIIQCVENPENVVK